MYDDQHIKLCQAIDYIIEARDGVTTQKVRKSLERASSLINSAIDQDDSYLDKETLEKFKKEMAEYEEADE